MKCRVLTPAGYIKEAFRASDLLRMYVFTNDINEARIYQKQHRAQSDAGSNKPSKLIDLEGNTIKEYKVKQKDLKRNEIKWQEFFDKWCK